MILLDTDHLTVLSFPDHSQSAALAARVATANGQTVAITVVNMEEPLRGWLAEINRHGDVHDQIVFYDRLAKLISFSRAGALWHLTSGPQMSSNDCAGKGFGLEPWI